MALENPHAITGTSPPFAPPVDPRRVRRKVFWRIIPLILVLYIIAYLDRANAGFAKLQMKSSLGFSDSVFGWGFGIFFAGYLLLEIPGALLVEHWSARKWFARILVTWGLCSMAMALVRTPWQFYTARFLLGLAEAGFFPGVIVYFTHWVPRAERGRAMAGLVLGVPVSLALGALVSGELLEVNWFGLPGWQWLFIVEGFPAVVMGVVVLLVLTDRPRQASWLTPAERDWLEQTLEQERQEAARAGRVTLGAVLRQPAVWLLALGILLANTGGYSMLYWLPTVVKNLLTTTGREATDSAVLYWLIPYYCCGAVGVLLSGQASDRTGQPKWHCVAGMAATGLCLIATTLPGLPWGWVFLWLCLLGFFSVSWPPPFWVLPTLSLSSSAAAVSIAVINICANLAGLIGNPLVGELKSAGYGDGTCLVVLACCYISGGVVIALLPVSRQQHRGRGEAEQ
jgi:ACS family tartrate transporter-like MFS transporter